MKRLAFGLKLAESIDVFVVIVIYLFIRNTKIKKKIFLPDFIAKIQSGCKSMPASPLSGLVFLHGSLHLCLFLISMVFLVHLFSVRLIDASLISMPLCFLFQFEPERMSTQIVARILVKVWLSLCIKCLYMLLQFTRHNIFLIFVLVSFLFTRHWWQCQLQILAYVYFWFLSEWYHSVFVLKISTFICVHLDIQY